ncbi:MAG: glycoside hydrolase family 88 protein [Bacteroidales bacterium]|nr:glycoside hydrolase family 88 protein [Bacteroidales bacterium]
MSRSLKYCFISIFILVFSSSSFSQYNGVLNSDEIKEVTNSVIDKIIRDTNFEFSFRLLNNTNSYQILDFSDFSHKEIQYSYSQIESANNESIHFSLSSNSPISIWINKELVFRQLEFKEFIFKEIAYDIYKSDTVISVLLNKGVNDILVRHEHINDAKFGIVATHKNGFLNDDVHFSLNLFNLEFETPWITIGPFSQENLPTPSVENGILPFYSVEDGFLSWKTFPQKLTIRVKPPDNASFTKHPYNEWHYSTGATLWSVLNFARFTQMPDYTGFVEKYCDFTIENLPVFEYQFHELYDIHGFNNRIFRMAMLDDAPAPALPFISLLNENKLPEAEDLIHKIADYVLNGQSRLPSGILCRPEPWEKTVWADDLFMSAPFFMMYGELTGDEKYIDEAANQILLFYELLMDKKTGLCHHGYCHSNPSNVMPFWSRANGWLIWGVSEVLKDLPVDHSDYKPILRYYKKHISALLKHQNSNGFLHQIIDDSETFEETSSTALLSLAMSRGINMGWLDKTYIETAEITWGAVASKIANDGTVTGICQGTSMSTDPDFYKKRNTPDHDPRGLGAVINAGMEILQLIENKN